MREMSSYKEEFFSEAAEHLSNMNAQLLELEKRPDDREVINSIFRSAHTLKGNGNTMGFIKFAELAHSIEDVLSRVRDRKTAVTPSLMDTLFEALDTLEDAIQYLEEDGNEHHFETALIMKKLSAYDPSHINPNEDNSIEEHMILSEPDWQRVNEEREANKNVFRVVGVFDSQCKIKFAKALLLLRELSRNALILKSIPSEDDIKTGKLGHGVEFLISTDKPKEEVAGVLAFLSGFDHIDLLGMDSAYDREKMLSVYAMSKEVAKQHILERNMKEAGKNIQTVKISISRLDYLMNLVGELLINNLRIQNISHEAESKELQEVAESFNRLVLEIQEEVMDQRMIPISQVFNRFPRMIRDLSKKENKKVNLVIEGEEIEFDRTVLDEIGDPLVHLLRNCVDHGIELPEERLKAGKADTGIIQLIASRRKNSAIIDIIDDGGGIDPARVKKAAISRGIISREEAETLGPEELQRLVFKPGLSTNETVTEISGRGVGMDVVENKTRSLGGTVRLESTPGKGTKVSLELPLTLAIVSSLLVRIGNEIFAIQLSQVDKVVHIQNEHIRTIQGHASFIFMEQDIPLVDLKKELNCQADSTPGRLTIVIVDKQGQKVGLIVDSIISQQQILIKPLNDLIKGTKGIAGAMILGGGEIGLILDVGAFI